MLGLGSSLCAQSYAGGDIKLVISGLTVDAVGYDDENVRMIMLVNDEATKAAMLNGITESVGAKVNGTCTVKLMNLTEYGATVSDIGVDTFNIFQINPGLSGVFFLSLATSDITISSIDDYYVVDLTANTWLDPAGADAELDVTGSTAVFYFHNITIDLGLGFEVSDAVDVIAIPVNAA